MSRYDYDDRDRLSSAMLGAIASSQTPSVNPPMVMEPNDRVDFRTNRTVSRLTAQERAVLGGGAAEVALFSFAATSNDVHEGWHKR